MVYINSLVTNMFLCGIFEHLLQEKGLLEIDSLLFVETNTEDRIRRVVSCLKTNALSDVCCSFPSHRSQIPNVYNISFFFFASLHKDKSYAHNQDVSFKWWFPVASLHSVLSYSQTLSKLLPVSQTLIYHLFFPLMQFILQKGLHGTNRMCV